MSSSASILGLGDNGVRLGVEKSSEEVKYRVEATSEDVEDQCYCKILWADEGSGCQNNLYGEIHQDAGGSRRA
ncbi:hypothetical protein MLD38_025981 [Melastoma candidum]|uniref:Uncharacterized protein n=1 Tax=Melastoma candidum TaxID=119954 RepID=A0ACB9NWU0_9MYRT|nr:hypothetical protein MLD38_025981 [Melastoma candidum]